MERLKGKENDYREKLSCKVKKTPNYEDIFYFYWLIQYFLGENSGLLTSDRFGDIKIGCEGDDNLEVKSAVLTFRFSTQ